MREQHPSRIHQIGSSTSKHTKSLVSKVEYDSEQQQLKDLDLATSLFVEGGYIFSLLQYAEDSFMICSEYKAIVFDLASVQKLKLFDINTAPVNHRDDWDLRTPLVSSHMVPDTDNCFVLEFYESQFIYLRNIKTGER